MKYAIIDFSGTQYKVSEGDKIEVNKVEGKPDAEIVLEKVALLVDEKVVKLGRPYLKDVQVKARIVDHLLGQKVIVAKFKAKTGYRRRTGFRAKRSLLEIKEIAKG